MENFVSDLWSDEPVGATCILRFATTGLRQGRCQSAAWALEIITTRKFLCLGIDAAFGPILLPSPLHNLGRGRNDMMGITCTTACTVTSPLRR